MPNSQLSDHIRQQVQQGKSKDEIKSELLRAGWQEADINQALSTSGFWQPSRPPAPSSASSFSSPGQQRLDPKAFWLFFLKTVFALLFIAIWLGFTFIAVSPQTISVVAVLGVGLIILLGILTFTFIWAKLAYHFYRYELIEEGFQKESGVIFKQYVTIPYDRIQNVNIYRGILTRLLGLSDLQIQTAGSNIVGPEGRLPALSPDIAEELRNELIRRARQTKNQGL